MKLQFPFIQLPLSFDAEALAAEVAAVDEACWRPHPNALPGNSMLPLVAVDGDPANEAFSGRMEPTAHLRACPYLMQVIGSLSATIGRSRLMRLAGQAEVTRHVDQGYYWAERVRVHVPIVTQPTVRFECGDSAINMAPGECWIFDTWRQHRVVNQADAFRIHLVVDTVGSGDFWSLVTRGRPHSAAPGRDWRPERVDPRAGAAVELECEAYNVPLVMTPWELNTHFGLLFGDALPAPQLPLLRHHVQRFLREWRGLWAKYADSGRGLDRYRAALQAFVETVSGPGAEVQLANGPTWSSAMLTLVAMVAVRNDAATAPAAEYPLADRA